jgi:ABC-type multidrug transport system fused ATPase/permease subunit
LTALILIWPGIGLILVVLAIVLFMLIFRFDKKIVTWIKEENVLYHKVNSLLVDYLSNIKTLITLRSLSTTERNLDLAIDKTYIPFHRHIVRTERKWFTVDSLLQISLQLTMIVYMYHTRSTTGAIVVGTITMIYQYIQTASNTFYNVAWQYSQMVQHVANTQSVDGIVSSYTALPGYSDTSSLQDRKQISVRNLSFFYRWQERKDRILSDISLSFQRGEKIALVGESGSGKSTFLSLLRWLYAPQTVQVDVDGHQSDSLACLFNDTFLIPQEPEIFEESIAFNISMWSNMSHETIERYSKIARFHEIAIWLPHGYDTNIKEKGVNLSGWQKQRLALARGLLVAEESSIVLLDESTSSVDSINEKKIYTNIFQSFSDKTIIAAIHKLHLLSMFDMIYVFDQWRIIESGTFSSLLTQWWMLTKMREEYQASQKKRK